MSSRRGDDPNIWALDIRTGLSMQMTTDQAPDAQPMWLPDGHRIVYQSWRHGEGGMWATDVATRREEPLVSNLPMREWLRTQETPPWTGEVQFAPSMQRLAFSLLTPPSGRRLLYVSDTRPFAPRAVDQGSASVGYPARSTQRVRAVSGLVASR